ncbi:hypothetical protein INR49_029289 [Caranx melampygus]|nr:hypothetical protein INR49_029289 [Caranx melampygus]
MDSNEAVVLLAPIVSNGCLAKRVSSAPAAWAGPSSLHQMNPGLVRFITALVCLPSCVDMCRVFVYGTLKKGQPNYFRMFDSNNGKVEFLASAVTTERYPLVIAGKYNVPFLLNIPGQGHRVHGEIYQVDDKMLKFLDDFEGVPTMYQRTLVSLEVKQWVGQTEGEETVSPGSTMEAFVYSTTNYQRAGPRCPATRATTQMEITGSIQIFTQVSAK